MADLPFPVEFLEGVRRFNSGRFFEAHEAFEDLLDAVDGDARWDVLVALIQVAVAYHKAASGHPGGDRMLRLGSDKLAALPPLAWGVEVGHLRRHTADDLAAVDAGEALADRLRRHPPRIRLASVAARDQP